MEMIFYQCPVCGQIVELVKDTHVPLICCGKEMKRMTAGSVDASLEKHLPVIAVDGSTVSVTIGSVPHPMSAEHSIEWVALETSFGTQRVSLSPGSTPKVCFRLCPGETVKAVYAFCNLHGLWKTALG